MALFSHGRQLTALPLNRKSETWSGETDESDTSRWPRRKNWGTRRRQIQQNKYCIWTIIKKMMFLPNDLYLLWIFWEKNLTNLNCFSSESSMFLKGLSNKNRIWNIFSITLLWCLYTEISSDLPQYSTKTFSVDKTGKPWIWDKVEPTERTELWK